MQHSQELDKLGAAMAAVQGSLKPAIKGSSNPYFKSKYADLQSCWDSCRSLLACNGLSVVQTFIQDASGESVTISTTLLHSSGQWISGDLTMKPAKADPQGIGSAITYARRYALAAIVGIVADEDDDGNAATVKAQPQQSKVSDANRAFLAGANTALVDRVLKKYGKSAISELSNEQAEKGIAFIKAELEKENKDKNPF